MGCQINGCTYDKVFGVTKCSICGKKACKEHYYLFHYTVRRPYDRSYAESKGMSVCTDCMEALLEMLKGDSK